MESHVSECHKRHGEVSPPADWTAPAEAEQPNGADGAEGATSPASKDTALSSTNQRIRNIRTSFTAPKRLVLLTGAVLAVCAGIVDVVAWLNLGSFVSHVSGNVAHMGMRVEGNHSGRDSPADLRESILLVLSFLLGSMLCGSLIARNEVHFGKGLYGLALCGNACLLVIAIALSPHEAAAYCLAAACGLQNGMCTMHFGAICRTTHVTGIITDTGTTLGRMLAISLRRGCLRRKFTPLDRAEIEVDIKKTGVYSALGFGFFFGAGGGAWLSRWFGIHALLVPASITGTGGAVYMFFRHRRAAQLNHLEECQLTDDMVQVETILERTRSFLNEVKKCPSNPEMSTKVNDRAVAAVDDLENQMHNVLERMRSVENSVGYLFHRGGAAGDGSPRSQSMRSPSARSPSVRSAQASQGRQSPTRGPNLLQSPSWSEGSPRASRAAQALAALPPPPKSCPQVGTTLEADLVLADVHLED